MDPICVQGDNLQEKGSFVYVKNTYVQGAQSKAQALTPIQSSSFAIPPFH
jgi:hypothetical protein